VLSVTDRLAVMRTELANERTLLAYIPTALALAAGGLAIVQFAGDPDWRRAGWTLLPAGTLALVLGVARYRRVSRSIADAQAEALRH
jgi:putative membrane protein